MKSSELSKKGRRKPVKKVAKTKAPTKMMDALVYLRHAAKEIHKELKAGSGEPTKAQLYTLLAVATLDFQRKE